MRFENHSVWLVRYSLIRVFKMKKDTRRISESIERIMKNYQSINYYHIIIIIIIIIINNNIIITITIILMAVVIVIVIIIIITQSSNHNHIGSFNTVQYGTIVPVQYCAY